MVDGAKIDFFFTPQRVRGMLRKAFKGNAKPPSLRVIELEHWARMLNAIRWMGRGWRGPWLDRGTHSEQTAQVMRALKDELPSELQPCIAAIDRHMAATKPHWMMGPPLQEWKDMALFLEGMLRSAGVTGNPSYRCIEYWVPYLTGERPTFGDIRAALIQRRFDRRPAKDLAAAVRWRELKRPKGKASGKR